MMEHKNHLHSESVWVRLETWLYVCLQKINVCLNCHFNITWNSLWAHHLIAYKRTPKMSQSLCVVYVSISKGGVHLSSHTSVKCKVEQPVLLYFAARFILFSFWMSFKWGLVIDLTRFATWFMTRYQVLVDTSSLPQRLRTSELKSGLDFYHFALYPDS